MKNGLLLLSAFAAGCAVVCWLPLAGNAQQPAPQSDVEKTANAEVPQSGTSQLEVDDESQPGSFWMEQKLRISKALLTGLATSDFDEIGRNAELMRGLNRVEAFVRRGPDGYRDHLSQFNMATNSMIRASHDENLEAATLAFNQLTVSCVACHQHLRSAGE